MPVKGLVDLAGGPQIPLQANDALVSAKIVPPLFHSEI